MFFAKIKELFMTTPIKPAGTDHSYSKGASSSSKDAKQSKTADIAKKTLPQGTISLKEDAFGKKTLTISGVNNVHIGKIFKNGVEQKPK